jgi:2-polyprenyl-3-methyl-5-hydroxy-6-metoxy-1,4-benzoquinol methylase
MLDGSEGPGAALSPEAVIWAFRLLLGREPSFAELQEHRRLTSHEALRGALVPGGYAAPLWLLAPPASARIPWRFEPPQLSQPVSQLCTASQFCEPHYAAWCATIDEEPRPHRKQWEFCWILAALRAADTIRPGARALGFGVGTEPLPAMLAANGVEVLATDAPVERIAGQGWQSTNQHSADVSGLYRSNLLDEATFRERVTFRPVDMNDIPHDLRDFDACWSSCCFEHLGSIDHGLDFVENSLETLRPGGVAVHTTEFNLGSNERTLETPGLSYFRRRDIERLLDRLAARGHVVWPLNLHPGDAPLDAHIDVPPYGLPHLKLEAMGQVSTSIGIVVQRAG